jgi:hypothetical protein
MSQFKQNTHIKIPAHCELGTLFKSTKFFGSWGNREVAVIHVQRGGGGGENKANPFTNP